MKQQLPGGNPKNVRRVWILDEGSQGHIVQSRGLIREISKVMPLSVTELPIVCVLPRRISRSIVKRLLRWFGSDIMFRCLHPGFKLPEETPDLVVSSGPHSLAALEYLARNSGCPSVFVQGTLHVPEGTVTFIMRPFEGEYRKDFIFIPLLFTEITQEELKRKGEEFLQQNAIIHQGPINALFIGNSSAKIRFSNDDWKGIVSFVNDLWHRDGTQWLITTSYRTGSELDQLFMHGIAPEAILQAVWYSAAPRKVTKAFLGLADRVFVTMDSLTMLTEAVASGRPTYALCPSALPEEDSNTHLHYVSTLHANGFITLVQPGRDEIPHPVPPAAPVIDYSTAIHQLLTRLNWTS